MKKLLYCITIILLIVLIAISSYFIYKQLLEEKKQDIIFEELADSIKDDTAESKINLQELYKQNNDLIGWIKIDNTNIDFPVMQTKKCPNYYLRKNFYKEYSYYGTPFIAEECNLNTSENLIIYGHNMLNASMFGSLENYKEKEYYSSHKFIKFYTLDRKSEYEIFAVFKTSLYQDNTFKYYQNIELETEEEYMKFVNKCNLLSFYDTEVDVKYNDKLITLSTCEYSAQNSRLVIIAKLTNKELE